MNQIVLIGCLTADPVLEKTESGISKCKFSLAVQDGATNKNGEKEVDFINSIAWRSTAEFISKYCKKGSLIGVIGKLKVRPYEKEGEKRYSTFVNVSNAEFVGYNKSQSGENANSNEPDLSAEFDEIRSSQKCDIRIKNAKVLLIDYSNMTDERASEIINTLAKALM